MPRAEVEAAREAARVYARRHIAAARTARAIFDAQRAGATITASRGVAARTLVVSRAQVAEVRVDGDLLIFPVVPMVQGVRRSATAPNPELFLIREYEKAAAGALAMPVVFDHPKKDGEYTLMRAPGPYDQHTGVPVGMVTSVEFTDDRMVAEVAVWKSKFAQGGPEAVAVAAALEAGQPVEVSIGALVNVVPLGGFYRGSPYFGVHTDVEFDHLALLPLGVPGACNWSAGCGCPRA